MKDLSDCINAIVALCVLLLVICGLLVWKTGDLEARLIRVESVIRETP